MRRTIRILHRCPRKKARLQRHGPVGQPACPFRAALSNSVAKLEALFTATNKLSPLDENGATAIEFAFIAPILILLLLGAIEFGIVLKNWLTLTNAVNVGAMQFAISRSDTNAYSDTVSALEAAAPSLTAANLTITLSVNGTACSTNATCSAALTSAAPSGGTVTPSAVTATYPCASGLLFYNFWSLSCTLSSTMTEGVQ